MPLEVSRKLAVKIPHPQLRPITRSEMRALWERTWRAGAKLLQLTVDARLVVDPHRQKQIQTLVDRM